MRKALLFWLGIVVGLGLSVGFYYGYRYFEDKLGLVSPLVLFEQAREKARPLLKYQIPDLENFPLLSSELEIKEQLSAEENFTSYLFTFVTQGGSMSGQLNLPKNFDRPRVILMMRGYVPPEVYQTGVGTRAAAQVFAQQGFITVAPDFLGFGESDPDFEDSWEGRFVKPVQMMELLNNLNQTDFIYLECLYLAHQSQSPTAACQKNFVQPTIGIWAHSNGGQIALTLLEGFKQSLPTSLWAPVTAPFPYSILFFTDEVPDEGKATRNWLAQFEKDYDVFAFSLTKHLDRLQGPLLIHHGSADEAALLSWSLELVEKIKLENERRLRQMTLNKVASASAQIEVLPEVEFQLFTYPGADHNLRPSWNTVVARDVEFFQQRL